MLAWLNANIGTILISLFLLAVVITVIAVMRKDKKKGVSACGGNCGHCPMRGSCHSH
ncbi:MAG: FeoB-associated Cys-rich membrane protein [Eubacteriales bacterium]|nr:FeoB-associated Cys-rich membrane protein [Eubacteriales bacterium]